MACADVTLVWGCRRTINIQRDAPSVDAGASKARKGAEALPAISHLFGWKERPFTRLLLVSNCAKALTSSASPSPRACCHAPGGVSPS